MEDVSELAFRWLDEMDAKKPATLVTIGLCPSGEVQYAIHVTDKTNDLATVHAVVKVLDQLVNNLRVSLAEAQASIEAVTAPKH